MKNSIKNSILAFLILLSSGCYAREMYLVDPVVKLEEQGINNILFLGFSFPSASGISPALKHKIQLKLYQAFDKFNAVNIIQADAEDHKEFSSLSPELLNQLAKKYDSQLIISGEISDYKELKYIDQPAPGFSQDNNPSMINNQSSNNLVRYQININGQLSLLKPDGKVLWQQKIQELESDQFEDLPSSGLAAANEEESQAYNKTKERLINKLITKVISNLQPYYNYK